MIVGPPPHSRGSRVPVPEGRARLGTTPAFAGITTGRTGCGRIWPDHPRIRGDHSGEAWGLAPRAGPPPHSRGSPSPRPGTKLRRRTTPAFAGITPGTARCLRLSRDHPRIRGDHEGLGEVVPSRAGPPPHSRGSRPEHVSEAGQAGTTPAFAGITAVAVRDHSVLGDHPRIRGDHAGTNDGTLPTTGPPPHSRGSHQVEPHHG